MKRSSDLRARIARPDVLVLDGATGTELERAGLECALPLWSAQALISNPEAVFEVHCAYVSAGVDLLTANTFRTQRRTLAKRGRADEAARLTASAVALARRAADAAHAGRDIYVLGSAPTLEDCYRPDQVPDDLALADEHRDHAANLCAAGVDAILVETMNTVREAAIATAAASETGLPSLVSFVCGDDAKLLSGEPLADAIRAVRSARPTCVLVNCIAPSRVAACIDVLSDLAPAFGVYPNLGAPTPTRARSEDQSPSQFASLARDWSRAGARIIGGCCGTNPHHIAAVVAALR